MRHFYASFKHSVQIQVCLNWGNATDLSVNLTEQCSGTCNRNVWCMSQRCYARRSVFAWPPDIKFFRQDLMNYLELMRSGQSLEQGAICPPLLIIQGSGMPKRMNRHTTQKNTAAAAEHCLDILKPPLILMAAIFQCILEDNNRYKTTENDQFPPDFSIKTRLILQSIKARVYSRVSNNRTTSIKRT